MSEAATQGPVRAVWDGKSTNFNRMPKQDELQLAPDAAYVHMCSNETIQGIQYPGIPEVGQVPLICDSSSDFLCRPVDVKKFAILFACAQKNIGPAGVTVVVIRKELADRSPTDLPSLVNYRVLAEGKSLLNTPPCFGVYMVKLVTDWILREIGGLAEMHQRNVEKAKLLYDVIDQCGGFYAGHAEPDSRSIMNVAFRLPNETLEKSFLEGAKQRGLHELKGHRSVGGCRASIYNAMPREGVQLLHDFMIEFHKSNA